MPSALPTITVGMIARPSRPSVRFTAWKYDDDEVGEHDEADRTQRVRYELEERDDQLVQGRNALREIGEIRGGRQSDCRLPEKLGLAESPFGLRCTTLR